MKLSISETEDLREEVEQLRVQLAGCLTAAEGCGQQCCTDDYGWSPAYQAVIELRKLYEKAAEQVRALDASVTCQHSKIKDHGTWFECLDCGETRQ